MPGGPGTTAREEECLCVHSNEVQRRHVALDNNRQCEPLPLVVSPCHGEVQHKVPSVPAEDISSSPAGRRPQATGAGSRQGPLPRWSLHILAGTRSNNQHLQCKSCGLYNMGKMKIVYHRKDVPEGVTETKTLYTMNLTFLIRGIINCDDYYLLRGIMLFSPLIGIC